MSGWEICAEAGDGREAISTARELKPHIAILDIGMPGLNGLEAARKIREESPNTEILILTFNFSLASSGGLGGLFQR
ncbi:MAG: response regulator [Candidatus Acidiferrales bacterium]